MTVPDRRKTLACLLLATGLSALAASSAQGEEAAACRADDVPELLALANWPLDAGCPLDAPAAGAPIAEDDLGKPVEIADAAPIPTVWANNYEAPEKGDPAPSKVLGRRLAAVDNEALDGVRGGFEPPDSNLKFSFGIERAVYINGQLVASTVLTLKDLQVVSGGSALAGNLSGIDTAGLLVVQNGAGNGFQIQTNGNALGTIIQNSLNNQNIRSITTINATVNTAQAMRAISIQSAIQNGLVNSLRR